MEMDGSFDKLLDSLPTLAADLKTRLQNVAERETQVAQRLETLEKREKACHALERRLQAREKAIKDANMDDKVAHKPKVNDHRFEQRKKWFEANMAKMNKLKNELTNLLAEAKKVEAVQKQQGCDGDAAMAVLGSPPAADQRHTSSMDGKSPAINIASHKYRSPGYYSQSPIYNPSQSPLPPSPPPHSFDRHHNGQSKRRRGDSGYDDRRNDHKRKWKGRHDFNKTDMRDRPEDSYHNYNQGREYRANDRSRREWNNETHNRKQSNHRSGYQGRYGERNEWRSNGDGGGGHRGNGAAGGMSAEECPRTNQINDSPLLKTAINPPQLVFVHREKTGDHAGEAVGTLGNGVDKRSPAPEVAVTVSERPRDPQEGTRPPGLAAPPSALPGGIILPEPLPAKRGPTWARAVPS